MRSLDTLDEAAAAVSLIRKLLFDLEPDGNGNRSMDDWTFKGIDALCALIAGELSAAHDETQNSFLLDKNAEVYQKLESLRLAYINERRAALKAKLK